MIRILHYHLLLILPFMFSKDNETLHTLLAKKLCDSRFLGKNLDLIHSHFNMYMYGFRSYLFFYIIKWYVG